MSKELGWVCQYPHGPYVRHVYGAVIATTQLYDALIYPTKEQAELLVKFCPDQNLTVKQIALEIVE